MSPLSSGVTSSLTTGYIDVVRQRVRQSYDGTYRSNMATVLSLLSVMSVFVAAVTAGMSKCDPAITNQMPSLYPNGIPKNIMDTIVLQGPYSYQYISSDEINNLIVRTTCMGVKIKSPPMATVTYKFHLNPSLKLNVPVKESSPGMIEQTVGLNIKYYMLYCKDGVMGIYMCCESCTGDTPKVGIAVADKLKNDKATEDAVEECKSVLADLGLDQGLSPLNSCT